MQQHQHNIKELSIEAHFIMYPYRRTTLNISPVCATDTAGNTTTFSAKQKYIDKKPLVWEESQPVSLLNQVGSYNL